MRRWTGDAILLVGVVCIVVAGILSGWGVVIGMIGVLFVVLALFAREG